MKAVKILHALLILWMAVPPRAAMAQESPEVTESPVAAVEEGGGTSESAVEETESSEPEELDPEARLARLETVRLEAEARIQAAESAWAGEIPIEEAFPELAHAPLDSFAWITGRLAVLVERGKGYAADRLTTTPEAATEGEAEENEAGEDSAVEAETPTDPPTDDPLRAAGEAAYMARTAADEMERRFLLKVLAHLEANPQLSRPKLSGTRIQLEARLSAAEEAFARAEGAAAEQRAREVLSAQQQAERLETLLRSLRLHATIDAPLPDPQADIDLLSSETELGDEARADAAELRLGLLLPFLDPSEQAAVHAALAVRQEAKEQAAAAESLEKSVAARYAELQTEAAAARQGAVETQTRLAERRREINHQWEGFKLRFDSGEKTASEIAEQPRGDTRRETADALYGDLRTLEGEILEAIGKARSASIEAERALASAQSEAATAGADIESHEAADQELQNAPNPRVFTDWREALDSRVKAGEELAAIEQGHHDQISALLADARSLRRSLAREVSSEMIRQELLADLRTEAKLLGPNMLELAKHRWNTMLELPSKIKDLHFSASLLLHGFWIVFVAVLNLALRRQAPRAIRRVLRGWGRDRRHLPRDLRQMARPAERTLKAAIDLAAGAILLWLLGDAMPELGLLYLIYLQFALYRFLVGLATLAVACHPEVRPALVTLDPHARAMVLTTVRMLALWLIARQFSRFFATRILAAITLDEALRLGFDIVLVALAVWLLHRWEPVLREALQRRDPRHSLVLFLTRRQLGPLAALQALAHAVTYAGLWIRSAFSQHVLQTTPTPGGEGARLPGEFISRVLRRECSEDVYVKRPATRRELDRSMKHWQTTRRRGAVMLIGNQGAGKRTLIDHWCRVLESQDQPVTRARLGERLTTSEAACRWLGGALSIENPPDEPMALAGRINAQLSGQVVIVDDLHFAFLRRVGGFSALQCLLSVVGSANSQIFWLLSMHRPGWHYLDSLGGWINTETCRRVIELEPFRESELRQMVDQRIATAGHEVGFTRLLPRSARHEADTDPLALERITAEFFRRLAWVSEGNPAVGLRLWRETLVPGRDDGRLEVARFGQPAALPTLRDPDLFLLAAIYTHGSLTEDELVEVTNMSPAQVSAAVRNLEARRLLTGRSKRFTIEVPYLPTVTAELRRRHFIHGSV